MRRLSVLIIFLGLILSCKSDKVVGAAPEVIAYEMRSIKVSIIFDFDHSLITVYNQTAFPISIVLKDGETLSSIFAEEYIGSRHAESKEATFYYGEEIIVWVITFDIWGGIKEFEEKFILE